jgi:predicted NBD/HSP70 family sugar kinase
MQNGQWMWIPRREPVKQRTGQPALLKEINRSRLFDVLKSTRTVSRAELARQTGLSRTTVGTLVDELLRVGLVRELGTGDSTGGRPPSLLAYNPQAALALGATIDSQTCTLVATDLDAQVVQRAVRPLAGTSCEAAVAGLERGVAALRAQAGSARILPAIGLGTPGRIDLTAGTVTAPDVGWAEVPIRRLAEEATGLSALAASRSQVEALAELWRGVGRDAQDLIYLSIGTDITAGIVHERRLYAGASSSAGGIGHVTILPDGPRCACGNRGCLQQLASGPAMVSRAWLQGAKSSRLRALSEDRPEHMTPEMVLQAAEEGDPVAQRIVEEEARYLGIAIANLVNLLNPEVIVLGGPVGSAGGPLLEPLRAEVRQRAMPQPRAAVRVEASSLGADAGAIGAAVLVLQQAGELLFAGT